MRRKVYLGTLQRRRDGMCVSTPGLSIYVPIGHDDWGWPAGTHIRVIFEPANSDGFLTRPDPIETESGHVLQGLSATIVQEIGMFAPPSDVLEEIRDYLTDWLEMRRGDDDSERD